ncbi:MAG: plastocyanin/azurin family copper-binding protein [Luteolibacter sp.]|uniref:plastocyanin/azurin family copper-binding protein n=1 Tax=Luteolibacter sp. TaxID=1962973 RepID=UPI0032655428
MKKLLLLAFLLTAPVVLAQAPVKVEITCNDQMTYNTKAFEVTVGDKVALTLKNVGKIPLKTMGHNLVILKPDTQIPMFAAKCGDAKNDYLPADAEMKKLIVKNTKRLGGGESDTIYFIPKEPGKYPFICTTPGHFSVMQGVMTVKEK